MGFLSFYAWISDHHEAPQKPGPPSQDSLWAVAPRTGLCSILLGLLSLSLPSYTALAYAKLSMYINPINLHHPVRDFIVISQVRKLRLSEVKRFAKVPQVSLSWHRGRGGGCYNWGRSSGESRNAASLRDS